MGNWTAEFRITHFYDDAVDKPYYEYWELLAVAASDREVRDMIDELVNAYTGTFNNEHFASLPSLTCSEPAFVIRMPESAVFVDRSKAPELQQYCIGINNRAE